MLTNSISWRQRNVPSRATSAWQWYLGVMLKEIYSGWTAGTIDSIFTSTIYHWHLKKYHWLYIYIYIDKIVVLQKCLPIPYPHHPHVDTPHLLFLFRIGSWTEDDRDGAMAGWQDGRMSVVFEMVASSWTRDAYIYIYRYLLLFAFIHRSPILYTYKYTHTNMYIFWACLPSQQQ